MMGRQLTNLISAEVGKIKPPQVGKIKPPKMGNFTPPLTRIIQLGCPELHITWLPLKWGQKKAQYPYVGHCAVKKLDYPLSSGAFF
jgi:hypothetical protein